MVLHQSSQVQRVGSKLYCPGYENGGCEDEEGGSINHHHYDSDRNDCLSQRKDKRAKGSQHVCGCCPAQVEL